MVRLKVGLDKEGRGEGRFGQMGARVPVTRQYLDLVR
jgi:hypothetical protein